MTSEILEILMSPDNPYLRLSTFGHAGTAHVSCFIIYFSPSPYCHDMEKHEILRPPSVIKKDLGIFIDVKKVFIVLMAVGSEMVCNS